MESILSMIILLPLLGFVFTGLLRNKLSKNILGIFSSGTILIAFGLAVKLFFTLTGSVQKSFNHTYFDWIKAGDIVIPFNIQLDPLSILMTLIITGIGFLIHIYSIGYMHEDEGFGRFFAYLNLFIFFMLLLVLGGNLLITFIGWEGVGLCSFLLIGFWFKTPEYNAAAAKAFIMNRIGDLGLLAGMFLILFHFGTLNYSELFVKIQAFQNIDILSLIALFLFIGAIGKSAQLPLYTWLPDAMAGPTPVSALIHAATMVTAGVFLIARFNVLYNLTPMVQHLICYVGIITSIFAGIIGLKQTDIKKVLAYSTVSQLGLMFLAIGTGAYGVAMFHITTHAFFKALLFLSAGAVIHALADEQDMRKMGGLLKILPFTYIMILIGSLSLMGFPFLTGFYSKDVILELAYAKFDFYGTFAHWLGILSAFFTAFYSFRLIFLTFYSQPLGFKKILEGAHDAPIVMLIPLFILVIGSVFIGYLFKDMIIGLGTPFWGASIFYKSTNIIMIDAEFIPAYIKMTPVIFSLIGMFLALLLYFKFSNILVFIKKSNIGQQIYCFLNKRWYFDLVSFYFVTKPVMWFGYEISFKLLDRGFIEIIGPLGFVRFFSKLSKFINNLNTGYIYHYAFFFILGLVLILFVIKFNLIFFVELPFKLFLIFFLFIFFFKYSKA